MVNGNLAPTCQDLDVSRETYQKLEIYQKLLIQWQKKTNLVATSTIGEFWHRHVADSLQIVRIKPELRQWTDIGSGGGFPGLVVAMWLAEHSNAKVTLVDSNHKKSAFLRTVARETGLAVDVETMRIEEFITGDNSPEVVTARAVSSLNNLLNMCQPWLSGETIGLFHKGRDYQRELQETHDNWQFDLLEHHSETSESSVLLEISNLLPV